MLMRQWQGLMLLGMVLLAPTTLCAQRGLVGTNPLPPQHQLNRFNLTRTWWGNATMDPTRDKLVSLSLDDEILIAQATNGVVTAFDNSTGKKLWATKIGRTDEISFPATFNEDLVLVVSGMTLFAIEKWTGQIRWEIRLPRFPSSSPAADATSVYIGFLDGSLVSFDLSKVDKYYKDHLLPTWSYATIRWRYQTNKAITVTPLPGDRLVYFTSRNGSMYAVSAQRRELVFQFETDAPLTAPLVRYKDSLLLSTEDFRIYSLNLENGGVRWQFVTGLKISKSPQVIEEDLYLLPERGGLYKLSARNGTQQWWRPGIDGFVSASPSVLYVSDRLHNLIMLARGDGAMLGALPLQQFTIRYANDQTDRLYMATSEGLIIALREREREEPIFYKYPERQPILPEFESDEEPAEGEAVEGEAVEGEAVEGEAAEGEPAEEPAE